MRVNVTAFAGTVAMAVALLVAACDKERCEPAPQTARSPDQSADLRKAAENSVRFSASNPDSVRFRGVQVWPQAVKNQFAVCGQANVFGPSSNTYVLFVVVVTQNDLSDDSTRTFKTEARVGSTVTEATKVYVDTLVRCYESGGPQNIMRGTAAPVPPMPSDTKTVLSGPTPAATGAPAAPAPGGPAAAFGNGAGCAQVHPCIRHGCHAPKWQHSDCTAGRNHTRRTSGQGTASVRGGTWRMAPDR